jgi:cobalt-zinc-cadmium resistance protein CzcA
MVTLFVIIGVFGYFSWTRLTIDAYPDIADVTTMIIAKFPGHSSETVEEQVTIPLERALNGMPGLLMMRSQSTFGLSNITLVFKDPMDDYFARQLVRERLIEADLPEGVTPEMEPLTSPIGEIYRYYLDSDTYSQRELSELQEWVVIPKLKEVLGVAGVNNFGGETTQFHCELDPEMLIKYNLSLEDVIEAVDINNANAGGGRVSRGDLTYIIHGIGLARSLDDIGNIVVTSIEGTPVFMRDLGELKLGAMERAGMGAKDDREDLVLGLVLLLRGEDPISTLKEVHKKVDELNNKILPDGVKVVPYYDRTELVEQTLNKVSFTLLQGVALVIVILLLFLGSVKASLIVATVIPVAMLVSFTLMYITGIPANLLSIGAISFGILVDAAIVIVESLQAKREKNPKEEFTETKVLDSTVRVARPIFFSVLIIISAHIPLFAFERIEAKFFTPMAYTVAFALGGALLFSLAVIPGLMLWTYKKPSRFINNKPMEWLKKKYQDLISFLLDKPRFVLISAALVIILTIIVFVRIGKEFLPYIDEGSIWITTRLPGGISIEKGSEMAADFRDVISEFPEVSYVVTQIGRDNEGTHIFTPSNLEAMVGLHPYKTWKPRKSKHQLIDEMDKRLNQMPGYSVGFSQPMIDMVNVKVAGANSEMVVKVFGDDILEARRIAEEVMEVLRDVEGAVDLGIDQDKPIPKIQIEIDRDAVSRYGINVSQISELIEVGIGGREVSEIFMGQRRFDIILRFPEDVRNTPEAIGNLLLATPSGGNIALSQVANISVTTGESFISREMNRRYITVKFNLRNREFSHFISEAENTIKQKIHYDPDKISLEWGGIFENKERAEHRVMIIVPMVLALIFFLLYAEFGTLRHPLIIMVSLPLAVIGGLLALQFRGMTVNVSSIVGFIALSGLAIQNGVILISNINRVKSKDSLNLKQAVISGSVMRLRPVLITALTTLFGVLPAVYALGVGSDIQRPLTTVVMGGLLSATLLTMIVLPVVYYLIEKRYFPGSEGIEGNCQGFENNKIL